MLFVGGPLHGHDIEVTPTEPPPDVIGGGSPALPDPYVDLRSSHLYRLVPWQNEVTDRQTGQPTTYVLPIYVSTDAFGKPEAAVRAAMADAVISAYFREHAEAGPATPAQLAASNAPTPTELFNATCQTCGPLEGSPHPDRGTRARAMQQHQEATGHTVRWSDYPSTVDEPEGQQ